MPDDQVAALRAFNRFHTRLVGALNEHLLDSDLSLPQLRVLYEIARAAPGAPVAAADLAAGLRIDPGYLSRLVAGLVRRGLVTRADGAGRRRALALTPAGEARFAAVDRASHEEAAALLAPLAPADRAAVIAAMARIRLHLGGAGAAPEVTLRAPRPGDLCLIASRQAQLYAGEYGWDASFEALVAEIVTGFARDADPASERCWIADGAGEVLGSIMVVRADDRTAKLRLLYVDRAARGQGLGRRLVDEAVGFARAAGYARIELWTNDVLTAARRIYEAAGFTLIRAEPHRSFGKDLIGQIWARDL